MAQEDPSRSKPFESEGEASVFGRAPGAGDWKRITRIGALVVLVIYVVLFFLWNGNNVNVSLVVTDVYIPLVFALILAFLLGGAVTYLLMYLRRRAVRKARQ
jgi:uncharacterized integral membrane protein